MEQFTTLWVLSLRGRTEQNEQSDCRNKGAFHQTGSRNGGEAILSVCVGRVGLDSNELRVKCRGLTGDVGQIVTGVASRLEKTNATPCCVRFQTP